MGDKQKFDGLSDDYDRFRPRYPDAMLRRVADLVTAPRPTVVDAGCGTGIALEGLLPLLGPDARCVGVDISADMVARCRSKFPGITVVVEPVEAFLERADGVDLIVAAQSFQWMDRPRFLRAAARCLAGRGVLAIIQNNRDYEASPFLAAYEELLEQLSPGYSRKYRDFDFAGELREHLPAAEVEARTADWVRSMPTDNFVGMSKSSTQAQRAIDAHGAEYLSRLAELLDEHATGGVVAIPYHSELFTARLPAASDA